MGKSRSAFGHGPYAVSPHELIAEGHLAKRRPVRTLRGLLESAGCPRLTRLAGVPSGRTWLDVGCGTGALMQVILKTASPHSVVGIDPSGGYIAWVWEHVSDDRDRFEVGDAQNVPFEAATFDAVVSGLVLNFVPESTRAVSEIRRVSRPGGTVAAYIRDYAGKMELMRYFWDAAVTLNPAARDLDECRRFPLCRPEPLERLFNEAGL